VLNRPFKPLQGPIPAPGGMVSVNKRPCGCAVSNLRVSNFQIGANNNIF